MSELKRCPFCGGEARHSTVFGRNGIVCNDCYCDMRGHLDATPEQMARAWNTRKPMGRIVERLEEECGEKYYNEGILVGREKSFIHIDEAIGIVKEEGGLNEQ